MTTLGGARRGYVRTWTNPYITDGLIAMWDGEWNAGGGVHDDSLRMIELTGKGKSIVFPEGEVLKDHIIYGQPLSTNTFYTSDKWWGDISGITTEVVLGQNNVTTSGEFQFLVYDIGMEFLHDLYSGSKIHWFLCRRQSDNQIYVNDRPGGLTPNITHSFSWSSIGNIRRDNSLRRVGTYPSESENTKSYFFRFGNGNSSGRIECRVYSIRIYARGLTQEEQMANYAVDKARFNLPD